GAESSAEMNEPAQRVANGTLLGDDQSRVVLAAGHPKLGRICLPQSAYLGSRNRVKASISQSDSNHRKEVFIRKEPNLTHPAGLPPGQRASAAISRSSAMSASISSMWS